MKKKDGTKKSFLNIFNLLTALVLIAAVAAALYFFVLKEDTDVAPELTDVEYIIEIKEVKDELTDKISVGDWLVDSVGQIEIGVVEEIEYTRSYTYELDSATATLVVSEYPDHSNLIVTVSAKAKITDKGYEINGCVINVGKPVYARFPNFTGTGHCISMNNLGD